MLSFAKRGKDRIFRRISLSLRGCKLYIVKHFLTRIPALMILAVVLCLSGCKDIRDIKVTSMNVESISPRGFKSLDIFLSVRVENPARQVRISEVDGSLIHSGKIIGKLAVDPFVLTARSSDTYMLKANVSLAKGAGLKDLMVIASPEGLNACTVDVTAKAAYGRGAPMPVKMKNIPLKELLDNIDNEKN